MMTLYLNECYIDVINYGQIDDENYNLTHIIFSHPFKKLHEEDEYIGHLYKDYEKASILFEINYN